MQHLQKFCATSVPDFTPLGGGRPDAAVAACAAVTLFTNGFFPRDIILPPDVADTTLAALCAPVIVKDASEIRNNEPLFRSPAVSIRLQSIDMETMKALRVVSISTSRLAVIFELPESVKALPASFLCGWRSITEVDLRRTSVQKVGIDFLKGCYKLLSVKLPDSLTEVPSGFLQGCSELVHVDLKRTSVREVGSCFLFACDNITSVVLPDSLTAVSGWCLQGSLELATIDLRNTALQTIGANFASHCPRLTSVHLPDSVRSVGENFLQRCGNVNVVSGSIAVQDAVRLSMPNKTSN